MQCAFETFAFPSPVIPLKSELAYKILERGRMKFWLQAEEISSNVTYKFFANDKELSGADASGKVAPVERHKTTSRLWPNDSHPSDACVFSFPPAAKQDGP